jgi:hypothetical protein
MNRRLEVTGAALRWESSGVDALDAVLGALIPGDNVVWVTGQLASVDRLRFVVPRASVRASANPRYFGQRGKGVTWLNYVNDQVAGLGGMVVTGTIRDSLHVLDGLLDLDGGTRPELVATDTASYSDQVFGLFALLGYQFSPRLADMPDQKSGASTQTPTTAGSTPWFRTVNTCWT